MEYGSKEVISVAISFSRKTDDELRGEILDLIKRFQDDRRRKYKVRVFQDIDTTYGIGYEDAIPEKFRKADIIICLVSSKFLTTEFIIDHESSIIKSFHQQKDKRVLPIIVTKTKNYENTWLGQLSITVLPEKDAIKEPYSNYKDIPYRKKLLKKNLDKAFIAYQKEVVNKRNKKKFFDKSSWITTDQKKSSYKNTPLFVLIILGIVISIFLILRQSTKQTIILTDPPNKTKDLTANEPSSIDTAELSTEEPIKKIVDHGSKSLLTCDPELPIVQYCKSLSNETHDFPRDISLYSYFGKEGYGIFDSCQGLDKYGNKPCKKDRRWYIVNQRLGTYRKLDLDIATHKKIYAIRPWLNNVAEVYFYENGAMCLEFCISMDDGKPIE